MERTIKTHLNRHNGNKTAVLDQERITDLEQLEAHTAETEVHPQVEQAKEEVKPLPPEKPRRKKPIGLMLAGLGVGAIAVGSFGYHWWQYGSTHQETDNATVAGHVHQISSKIPGTVNQVMVNDNQQVKEGQLLVKLDPRDYDNKVQQAAAALQSARRQANAAKSNISLASQTTSAKTSQAQGDVNAALASISTAQAAVEEARSGIPAAEAAVQEAQAGIPAAQAQVAQADANLQKAQVDYKRYQDLYRQGAIPSQQLDTARATYGVDLAQRNAALQAVEQAKARLASAKQGVAKAKSQLAQAQESVATAQGKLASFKGALQQATAGGQQTLVNRSQYEAALSAITQAASALQDAQLQLSYTSITAPTSGRIGQKIVEVGNRVQVGTLLMSVVDNENWVVANFKETQLENMKPGEEAEIKLDAFPHHIFEGHVDSISPASGAEFALLPPDNATGNFTKIVQRIPAKIVFDPQSIKGYESRITPGMSAVVSVRVK